MKSLTRKNTIDRLWISMFPIEVVVIIGAIIIACVACVTLFASKRTEEVGRSRTLTFVGSVPWSLLEPLNMTEIVEQSNRVPMRLASNASSWIVPIEYSHADSGFVVRLRVGADVVVVVCDTGSNHLGIATTDCANSGMCMLSHPVYNLHESRTAQRHQITKRLTYASLEMDTEVVTDQLGLFVQKTDGSDCWIARSVHLTDTTQTEEVSGFPMTLFAAHQMRGTDSNVLGLMNPSSDTDEHGFLRQLFEYFQMPPIWSFLGRSDGTGFLSFGPLQFPEECHELYFAPRWFPMSSSFTFGGAYVLDCKGCVVGDETTPCDFIVIDTGTTHTYFANMYVPEKYHDAFSAVHDSNANGPDVRLRLDDFDIHIPSVVYLEHLGSDVFQNTIHWNEPIVNRLFPHARVCLLGISHMKDIVLTFDCHSQRIGLSMLREKSFPEF